MLAKTSIFLSCISVGYSPSDLLMEISKLSCWLKWLAIGSAKNIKEQKSAELQILLARLSLNTCFGIRVEFLEVIK